MLPRFLKKSKTKQDQEEDQELEPVNKTNDSETNDTEAGYFNEENDADPPLKEIPHVQTPDVIKAPLNLGRQFLLFTVAILSLTLALPTLLIFLIKSPPPLATVTVLGVSYYMIYFCFMIGAISLIFSTVIFLNKKLPIIAGIFLVSLFCSIPLVIGLRHDLTAWQSILNIAFFAKWPYFLHPFFIFVSLLLPAAILMYLLLHIQTLFTRERHNYVFISSAAFLALAFYLGSYELNRAGMPNITTLIKPNEIPASLAKPAPPPALFDQQAQVEETAADQDQLEPQIVPAQQIIPEPVEEISVAAVTGNTPLAVQSENIQDNSFVNSTTGTGIIEVKTDNTDEVARLELKLTNLLAEIDSKIIKLTQLKSAIDTQKQTDFSLIKNNILLINQKIDLIVGSLDENPAGVEPENSKIIVSNKSDIEPEGTTLKKMMDKLDSLTKKVNTIPTGTNDASGQNAEPESAQ